MSSARQWLTAVLLASTPFTVAVPPADADDAGRNRLVAVREAYAALDAYRDETRCDFQSGTRDEILVENDARFAMSFAGDESFSLSNLMGVDLYGEAGARTARQYQVKRFRTISDEEPWRSVHPIAGFSDVVYPVLPLLLDAPHASPFDAAIKAATFDEENRTLVLTIDGRTMGLATDFPVRWVLDETSKLIERYAFDFRPGMSGDSPPRLVAGACDVARGNGGESPAPRTFAPSAGDVEVSNFALAPDWLRADANDDGTQKALISRIAPAFTARLLSGGELSLAEARGKVVVLDFWATWCPNCALSWAHMKRVEDAYADASDVVFYGVNLDSDDVEKIEAYLNRFDIHTPQLLDPSRDIASAYRVAGTPAVAVIGKNGDVREIRVGQSPTLADDLIEQIRTALAE